MRHGLPKRPEISCQPRLLTIKCKYPYCWIAIRVFDYFNLGILNQRFINNILEMLVQGQQLVGDQKCGAGSYAGDYFAENSESHNGFIAFPLTPAVSPGERVVVRRLTWRSARINRGLLPWSKIALGRKTNNNIGMHRQRGW